MYGFFAALVVAPAIRGFGQTLGMNVSSESALAAGLVMGIMIIPFVSSLSDDMINAVPQDQENHMLDRANTEQGSKAPIKPPPQQAEVLETVGEPYVDDPRMVCRDVNVYYGEKHAIREVSLDIGRNEVIAMIGPSGCGKSTFIRCLNRMNDTIEGCRITGTIQLDDVNIYDKNVDVVPLRAQVGMVFQKPNPFPKSIYDNIAYGPKIHGLVRNKAETDQVVETTLIKAGLWEEVKDRLDHPGTGLSGGQQQRLCIARTIAVGPEVILMDEPCSTLDPIATGKIEDLIDELLHDTQLSHCC